MPKQQGVILFYFTSLKVIANVCCYCLTRSRDTAICKGRVSIYICIIETMTRTSDTLTQIS